MFIAERTTYVAPIMSPEALADSCPEVAEQDTTDQHLITVKTCNSPELLERSLISVAEHTGSNVAAIVVDDSSKPEFRAANQRVANEIEADCYPVLARIPLSMHSPGILIGENKESSGKNYCGICSA